MIHLCLEMQCMFRIGIPVYSDTHAHYTFHTWEYMKTKCTEMSANMLGGAIYCYVTHGYDFTPIGSVWRNGCTSYIYSPINNNVKCNECKHDTEFGYAHAGSYPFTTGEWGSGFAHLHINWPLPKRLALFSARPLCCTCTTATM